MNTSTTPPVRELSHGDHNAHLLAAWKRECPYPYYWTRSTLTETPYSVDDFVRDVWEKLTAILAKHPKLKGHRWDYDRPAQYYLAFETVDRSVRGSLQRQAPLEDTARALRSDLVGRVNVGSLLSVTPVSKLWGKGRQVFSEDKQHEFWVDTQISTSRYDRELFLAAAGGNLQNEGDTKAMQELLLAAVPQLCTLETGNGNIVVLEQVLRKQLWKLMSGKTHFTAEMRMQVTSAVMDAWENSGATGDLVAMATLEGELTRQLFTRDRTQHWEPVDKKGIGEAMKTRYKVHPFGTREERLAKLLELEWADTEGVTRTKVRLVDGTAQHAIEHAMGPLLKLGSLSEDQRGMLRERLPVLEWHIVRASQQYADLSCEEGERREHELELQYLQGVLTTVGKLMPLPWDEFPHIAYASLALYSQGQDATPRGLQGML